ncbi:hypothetical protein ACFQ0X_21555 [Streptomyces rectiviolaceus]|uniref:hypothetical protein n=1 Tax=Streptomyces rectiviolaceus TaxID=332591 RepID=UPI0036344218
MRLWSGVGLGCGFGGVGLPPVLVMVPSGVRVKVLPSMVVLAGFSYAVSEPLAVPSRERDALAVRADTFTSTFADQPLPRSVVPFDSQLPGFGVSVSVFVSSV